MLASTRLVYNTCENKQPLLMSLVDLRVACAEIVRECAGGRRVRLIRRTERSGVRVLEITEDNTEGRRFERHLVLERR